MEGNEDAKGEVIPTKELVTSDNVQSTPDLVPARMLNEYAYCPRLAYLEWVQGEFADSVDTIEGRFQHRRVDRPSGKLPSRPTGAAAEPAEEDDDAHETIHARSVMLSDNAVGAIARIDLIEGKGNVVTPVDYKHGKAPDVPEGAWEPERVQVCIQGLLLRANGYICTKGILYFVESRQRVTVPFDDALITRTLELLSGIRGMASSGQIPQPLVDSPKCPRCSLVGICLPDEVNLLSPEVQAVGRDDVRRMAPARDDAVPVYVHTQGAVIGKSGDQLEVKQKGRVLQKIRLMEVSHLSLFGNVQVTTQMVQELCKRDIPHLLLQLRRMVPWHNQRHEPQERGTALPAISGSNEARGCPGNRPADNRWQDKELPHATAPEPPEPASRDSGRDVPAGGPGADGLVPGYIAGHRGSRGPNLLLRVPGHDQGRVP